MKKTVSGKGLHQSVALILRFAIQLLIRAGMVHQTSRGELKDLKGLIDLSHITDLDLELLHSIDDDKIRLLLQGVDAIDDAIGSYLNIYHLKEQNGGSARVDAYAQQFFNPFSWVDQEDYQVGDTAKTYLSILGLLDALIRLEQEGHADWHNRWAYSGFKKKYARCKGNYPKPPYCYGAVHLFYVLFLKIQDHLSQCREFENEKNI